MAGKSTVLRQAALIVLMAQAGSFVPARSARIGRCDRIFTRVGASDNLSRGQSTFMVEMSETAQILAQATARSLVVLDEIGRGTSTFDGLSIAWAVAEDLHDRIGARTLFATHYHELQDLTRDRPRVLKRLRCWPGRSTAAWSSCARWPKGLKDAASASRSPAWRVCPTRCFAAPAKSFTTWNRESSTKPVTRRSARWAARRLRPGAAAHAVRAWVEPERRSRRKSPSATSAASRRSRP